MAANYARPNFIRVTDVARRLNITAPTVRSWARTGKLPEIVRLSRKVQGWPDIEINPVVDRMLNAEQNGV